MWCGIEFQIFFHPIWMLKCYLICGNLFCLWCVWCMVRTPLKIISFSRNFLMNQSCSYENRNIFCFSQQSLIAFKSWTRAAITCHLWMTRMKIGCCFDHRGLSGSSAEDLWSRLLMIKINALHHRKFHCNEITKNITRRRRL